MQVNVRNGSWSCKKRLERDLSTGSKNPSGSQAAIAAIRGLVPTMFMTRVRSVTEWPRRVMFGSIVDFSLVLLGDLASVPAALFCELSDNSDCQISNREVSPCHSKCKSLRPYFFIIEQFCHAMW